jgi:mono/diheme cytochrome c family protein
MFIRHRVLLSGVALVLASILSACLNPNPQAVGLTPIPTLAPAATITLIPALPLIPAAAVAPANGAVARADAASGAPIFLQNCSPCHGTQGQGISGLPLRNSMYIQTAGDQAVYQTIANGRPDTQMPAWLQVNGGPFTDVQILNVIAYLYTLQNVPAIISATLAPPAPTETPLPAGAPTASPVQPSNPGGQGAALTLTGNGGRGKALFGQYCAACHGPEGVQGAPNPGSGDGVVPVLNPIDPTLVYTDAKVFAKNIDLFVEHGSTPAGPSPLLLMPSFGDSKMLNPQQVADLIAYIISLNGNK